MIRRAALPLASALALSTCVAGPPPQIDTSPPVLPLGYAYAPEAGVAGKLEDLLPDEDPAFSALVARALETSPTLGEAAARIDAARASAARAGAKRMPRLDAGASVTGQRTNPAQFAAGLPPGVQIESERISYGVNLAASWAPDLFGRLRAQERAQVRLVEAAGADGQAVRNALVAEIAGAVIDWRTLARREGALREDLAAATELARLAGVRERVGIAPGFDRVRAETSAETTRSRLAALASERARLTGQLVTLTASSGRDVLAALAEVAPRPERAAPPPTLPGALLQNRPDILAASARLAVRDEQLAATAARRFPNLSLSAVVGLLAFGIGDLFDPDSIVGSLAADVAAPLLDFGRIEAEIDGAAAEKRGAFEAYRGTVFAALGEAEAAYGLVAATDAELAAARREEASSIRSADLANTRYEAGLADFLTVIEARRVADGSAERAAAALGRALRARVLLWQALGGTPATGSSEPEG
ncbi:MAG: multidrug transporter [Sphingomonadales bacterium CG12_big_fil_rev_8_21_14_0_65_65_10]|nr:MAG: multidrug transporter [Sphingomonadales bacterium CG12_big_fil_rev_8_21_14_0_65_65_10]